MFSTTRARLLAVAATSALAIGGAVALATGAPTDPPPRLTAQEICLAKPILIPCDQIDSLEPARRAALEEDARSVLKGRSPAQALSDARAAMKKQRESHPIKMAGDAGSDPGVTGGEITDDLNITIPGFTKSNAWLAPYRLVGGTKNAVKIYVGAAPDDPTQGLLVREADGDTVPAPNGLTLTPVALPGDHGAGAHIVAASGRGVLTIGFSNRSTVHYDAIHARFE